MKKIFLVLISFLTFTFAGRYYDADVGFFVSVDPGEEFWNPYSYVGDNPIHFIDPTGLYTEVIIDAKGNVIDQWFIDDGDHTTNVYQEIGNQINLLSTGIELLENNYLYSGSPGNWTITNILGASFLGDMSPQLWLNNELAHLLPPGFELFTMNSGQMFDYKNKVGAGNVGFAYGRFMTARDAGNAWWGGYMRQRYKSESFMIWVSNKIAHGNEDVKSLNMQKWGYNNNVKYPIISKDLFK